MAPPLSELSDGDLFFPNSIQIQESVPPNLKWVNNLFVFELGRNQVSNWPQCGRAYT